MRIFKRSLLLVVDCHRAPKRRNPRWRLTNAGECSTLDSLEMVTPSWAAPPDAGHVAGCSILLRALYRGRAGESTRGRPKFGNYMLLFRLDVLKNVSLTALDDINNHAMIHHGAYQVINCIARMENADWVFLATGYIYV